MGIIESMRLDGKKGFVTGAARGIGKCTATGFAEAGADAMDQGEWYWGDPFEDIKAAYDPATGTITFDMDFGSATRFYVTLTK